MFWIFVLILTIIGGYFWFRRKSRFRGSNEAAENNVVYGVENTKMDGVFGRGERDLSIKMRETKESAGEVASEGEEKDNWERFDHYRAVVIPAKGRYRIIYEDQRELKTERDIEVKRVYDCDGKFAIDAHCFLRDAHRSFLGDRIRKAVNLDSGEVVQDLARDAMAQYKNSGEGRAQEAIARERTGVAILLFVSRADGQMRREERDIISEYLVRRCSDLPLDKVELDSAIKVLSDPDNKEFKRIVRELRADGDDERLVDLFSCAKRIVETQKAVAPMEQAALEILQEAIASRI